MKHDDYFYKRYSHVKDRLMDRYGINIQLEDFISLDKRFEDGDYEHVKKSRHRSAGHYIKMELETKQIYFIVRDGFIRTAVSKNQMQDDSCYSHKNNVKESHKDNKERINNSKQKDRRRKIQ